MRRVAIDANLLVLLIVGFVRPDFIAHHKRLREFDRDAFRLLESHLGDRAVMTTPNAMTEASNLIVYGVKDPLKSQFLAALAAFAARTEERYAPSREIGETPVFLRLGLTDSAWLRLCDSETELLTVDLALYQTACHARLTATNFTRLRDL